MKFARYLEETQIPEWKKAYIDFKGLKRQIAGIRNAAQVANAYTHDRPLNSPKPVAIRPLADDRIYHIPLRHLPTFHGAPARVLIQHPTVQSLYSSLNTLEASFFAYLDDELGKVDTFYNEQENIAVTKLAALKDQLHELREHRRLLYKSQGPRDERSVIPRALCDALRFSTNNNPGPPTAKSDHVSLDPPSPRDDSPSRDPSDYQDAKRKLKKAFQEFYRGLELLNDYRVQNLTGFRKALKKFEKVTRHPVQDLYMRERIQPRRFAFGGTMDYIMREVELTFTERFENGDRKKARRRLKSPFLQKSHHFSTFRSGIYFGMAIPALVIGIYKSFQPEIRQKIPDYDVILQIYSGLVIPVVFSLLVGINLLVWSRARINFPFIFELDVRTAIDTCKYFELPTIMFATLSYAFLFTSLGIGNSKFLPTSWPAVWIGFVFALFANPIPILSRSSRYWFLKNIFRLLFSWRSRVEFTEFWLADQFCSLAYTMGQFYTIICAYSHVWSNALGKCDSRTHWAAPLLLMSLPSVIRMVQSLRRYYESRLVIHLINAGKYVSSVLAFLAYDIWLARGEKYNYSFVLWCLLATFSSAYTSAWDILMDWSLLSRRFLRPELVYSDNPSMYYFAIISNILVRFIWIIYIPGVPVFSRSIRAFIAAILEMLRRFQWNFYRLENEQLGNTDQYRATREVPLPYSARG